MNRMICLFAALLSGSLLFGQAGIPNGSTLTIEQIMQGEAFIGNSPSRLEWDESSSTLFFDWNPDQDTLSSLYKVDIRSADPSPVKVSLEEQKRQLSGGVYNRAYTAKVLGKDGDLFLLDLTNNSSRQLTNTIEQESPVGFSGDEKGILFTKGNNLFLWNMADGAVVQLTNIREGAKRSERSLPEYQQWLQEDQLEHFEILAQRNAEREARQRRSEALQPDRPLEIYIGKKRIFGLQASPDLRFVTFLLMSSADGKRTKVPNYVTESGYIEDINARSKVGTPQNTYEFGIYDRQRDTFYTLDTKQIEGIYDKPEFLKDYHQGDEPYSDTYKMPREVILRGPLFSTDGQAIVQARAADNKDRWILLLDLEGGKLEMLDRQHDEAWIGGPGIGRGFSTGTLGWLSDNRHIYFQSEETGYSHLYVLDVKTGEKRALTSGQFEVLNVDLSRDQQTFYLTANAEGPHEQHFYHLPVSGGALQKVTSMEGNNAITISPDEKYLAIRYSSSNRPWEAYVMENKAGATAKRLTKSTTAAFEAYNWRVPEIVWFKASDGVEVPARIYRPVKPKKGGPAVIFVHGAGYLQNVHKWWSSYYREYMFHNYLADNGYTVLDIDYRGSAGYGRDWRTAIYRHMGGKDLSDQVDGARFLVQEYGVNPDKIGIYGGSYGGFITLMGMFTSPGTFKSGAALRSVTDWAHYNHGYTSNILNTPVEDSIAYRRSSPIYHAEGLQGELLILHGMIDDNVQFQDVVRLAQRLIELGKDNWEFAVFPVERHGFVEPSSWADEYKRIFKLFQQTLK